MDTLENLTWLDPSSLSKESFPARLPVVVFLLLLHVVGLFGNGVVLLVYSCRYTPSVMRVFIMAMAVSDLLTSVVGIPLQLVTIRHAYETNALWLCRGMFAAATLPSQSSGAIQGILAVDRYRRICTPQARQLSLRMARLLVSSFAVLTSAVFVCFVPLYGTRILHVAVRGSRARVMMCWYCEACRESAYLAAYKAALTLFFFCEFFMMLFSYSFICKRLKEQSKTRNISLAKGYPSSARLVLSHSTVLSDTTSQIQNMASRNIFPFEPYAKATNIMAAIIILYVLNWLPHLLVRLVNQNPVNWCEEFTKCGFNSSAIALRSTYINSVINPFIYSFCNSRFRSELRAMLGISKVMNGTVELEPNKVPSEACRRHVLDSSRSAVYPNRTG